MKQNKTKTHIQMTLSQDVMVEQERTSDPASTGEVGGLASDPHMVDETMNFDSQGTVTKKNIESLYKTTVSFTYDRT